MVETKVTKKVGRWTNQKRRKARKGRGIGDLDSGSPSLEFLGAAIQLSSDLRDKHRELWQTIPVTVITDTHRLISNLTERGFTAQQAEAVVDAIQDIDLREMASKEDILRLEHKLEKLELALTLKLGSLLSAGIAFLAFLRFFG